MKPNPHIDSTLEDFLKVEGLFEDASNHAAKVLLAWQAQSAIQMQSIAQPETTQRASTIVERRR